jgi:hypothetical protein
MNTAAVFREINDIRAAERAVAPYVGAVLGMDSAAAVYRHALTQMGHDCAGVHASALPAIWEAHKRNRSRNGAAPMATDSSSGAGFRSRFPHAAAIKAI